MRPSGGHFTVAANQSAADTTDIIAGLRTFGPVAAGMGIGFEDAAAAIALFTNFGLKATVAGTALRPVCSGSPHQPEPLPTP